MANRLSFNIRSFLIVILFSLITLILVLLYYYYLLAIPKREVFSSKNFQPMFSIYGYGGKREEQLKRPHDVAFDRQGNIYIVDAGNSRVLVFDNRGNFLFKFGEKGIGKGQLLTPMGITVDNKNRIYIADQILGKIAIFSSKGRFKKEFRVMMPLKPQVADSKLYLTTYAHLMIFNLKGEKLYEWGKRGRNKNEVNDPIGLALSKDGNIYISDTDNLRIQALDKRLDPRWVIGKPASTIMAENRTFGLPAGLAVDEQGYIYLVDAFNHQIKVLDSKGKDISTLSHRGNKEGELYFPAGIAYYKNGIFAIADKYNDRVQVVRINLQ